MLKAIFWLFVVLMLVIITEVCMGLWSAYVLLGVWGLVGFILVTASLLLALIVMVAYCLEEIKASINKLIEKIKPHLSKIVKILKLLGIIKR